MFLKCALQTENFLLIFSHGEFPSKLSETFHKWKSWRKADQDWIFIFVLSSFSPSSNYLPWEIFDQIKFWVSSVMTQVVPQLHVFLLGKNTGIQDMPLLERGTYLEVSNLELWQNCVSGLSFSLSWPCWKLPQCTKSNPFSSTCTVWPGEH